LANDFAIKSAKQAIVSVVGGDFEIWHDVALQHGGWLHHEFFGDVFRRLFVVQRFHRAPCPALT
jgi:hypothetical protein